jgi:branched-chain amino acid aminotransferase
VATYYIDGEFVPADKAVIPVDDLALLRGIGVFDLLRTYDGQPYFLDAHIERLEKSPDESN